MSSAWPFLHLNHLTPENAPIGSTSADDLTFPVDSADLSRQLEAWTNITFAFDEDGDQPAATPSPFGDLKKDEWFESAEMEHRFNEDSSGSSTARADLDALLGGDPNPYNSRRGVGTSTAASSSGTASHPLFARTHENTYRNHQLGGGGLGLPQELRQPTFGGAVVSGHGGMDQPQHVFPHDLGVLFPSTTSGAHSGGIQSSGAGSHVSDADLFASLPLHWGVEQNAVSTTMTSAAAAEFAGLEGLEGLAGLAELAAAHSAQPLPSVAVPIPQGQTQTKGKKGASNTSSPANSTQSSPAASSSKRLASGKGDGANAKAGAESKGKSGQGGGSGSGKDGQPAEEEEVSKVAIEEDKRRRNTAASARFRVKKKLREQAIERTASELRDRVGELEKEVEGLKKENGWLRGLIVDRAARDASANANTANVGSSSSTRSAASASRSSSAAASASGDGKSSGEAAVDDHGAVAPVVAGVKRARGADD